MTATPPTLDRRFDLLGLGECMVELHAAEPLASATVLQRGYGGDVLNALVGAARLGARTGFITRVGDDPFGAGLLGAWQAEGVDVSRAPLVAGDNGVYFISVAAGGEREFCYRRQGSPASQLGVADLDESYIASAHWLLLSGITQALSPDACAATLAAAQIARRHGVKIAYDPNYRPRLWAREGGPDGARAAFDALLPYADWVLPSHPADAVLLGPAHADASDPQQLAAAFAQRCPNVALKCGPDGAVLVSGGQCVTVAGVLAPSVIDTTGAGDLWNGSFIVHLLRGAPPHEAAAAAHRLAAAKLAHRGAIPPRGRQHVQ